MCGARIHSSAGAESGEMKIGESRVKRRVRAKNKKSVDAPQSGDAIRHSFFGNRIMGCGMDLFVLLGEPNSGISKKGSIFCTSNNSHIS